MTREGRAPDDDAKAASGRARGAVQVGQFVLEQDERIVAEAHEVDNARLPAVGGEEVPVVLEQALLQITVAQPARAQPVLVVGRDIGRPGESLEVTTLGALDPEAIDKRCLLIVGASGTSVGANDRVWTRRSVSS